MTNTCWSPLTRAFFFRGAWKSVLLLLFGHVLFEFGTHFGYLRGYQAGALDHCGEASATEIGQRPLDEPTQLRVKENTETAPEHIIDSHVILELSDPRREVLVVVAQYKVNAFFRL
ncbi:hypothetical protein CYMTET_4964 [Cymbomonas tetramitiformis]|uniref:Uncharacterized protein n=1 Tax=Cymbomonas tetramitiformis TaxID=36881 RepID=A0AAE0H0A8_9CHLO|nr:hypothetical protein CYMTET_4964 [Cymbomonas tetramitiformis]